MNNKLARTFAEELDAIEPVVDPDSLRARVEPAWYDVPEGVKFITAGVDVQSGKDARLEVEVVGWGDGLESWSLGYLVIQGDIAENETWATLDDYLNQPWQREDGKALRVAATAIDTGGHEAEHVSNYCRPRQKMRRWAIRGRSDEKGKRSTIWPNAVRAGKWGCPIYQVSSGAAKDVVEKHLAKTQPGPGYMHIPHTRGESWFKQMVSEHRVQIDMGGGVMGTHWRKRPGYNRNEALDCRAYAYAALAGLRTQMRLPIKGLDGIRTHKPTTDASPADAPKEPKKKLRRTRPRSQAVSPGW
jgi:phage terminase large subunit GpA-like protein